VYLSDDLPAAAAGARSSIRTLKHGNKSYSFSGDLFDLNLQLQAVSYWQLIIVLAGRTRHASSEKLLLAAAAPTA
jgi:hypothetical protein